MLLFVFVVSLLGSLQSATQYLNDAVSQQAKLFELWLVYGPMEFSAGKGIKLKIIMLL